jgi:hypothetical protein
VQGLEAAVRSLGSALLRVEGRGQAILGRWVAVQAVHLCSLCWDYKAE